MKKRKNRNNGKSIVLTEYCQQLKKAIEIEPTEDPFVGIIKSLVASLKVLLQLRPCKIVQCIDFLKNSNNNGKYDLALKKLGIIQVYLVQSGFNKNGVNRTPEKETVTNHTVYLNGGNGSDLADHSVQFWINLEASENKNRAFNIIAPQAKQFIESHILPVINNIEEIGQSAQSISVAI